MGAAEAPVGSAEAPAGSVARALPVNTGNPRITVAFPFSRIVIGGSDPGMVALAGLLWRLADALADLAGRVDPDNVQEPLALAEEAKAVAAQIAAG